ncbi:MAG TPA: class I SAM-dependent methyltransferase [Lacibacter sp.]|nr:class I SAM-dependent methyltransferase [Lacibacter sp.]HMO89608.1 class I SAM-dependent methyltransferase [Lacibacter sp.]
MEASAAPDWYKDWFNSPYYHLLYFQRDEQEAAAFIAALLNKLQPPPGSRMLDVACGKGRHSVELAVKDFLVTGIDISEASITEAKKAEHERLEFFVHDMRLPFRMNYYHYVFNFFTSFGYFRTRREHDSAIRTMARALRPGGVLVMDYLNPHYVEDHLVYRSELEVEGVTFLITRWLDETHFYKKIVVEDEARLQEPLVYQEKVAKFSLGDFNDMFSYNGLQVQEVFGDYHFEPYHVQHSPRMILLARKIK